MNKILSKKALLRLIYVFIFIINKEINVRNGEGVKLAGTCQLC